MLPGSRRGIERKTPDQVELMRAAGLVVASALALLREAAVPGVSTRRLDELAEQHIRDRGAVPSFLGYGEPPFPATICVSVGEEVVHGIPGDRVLVDGDLVSIDCGAVVAGWHADAAVTVPVGEVGPAALALVAATEAALAAGVAAVRPGARVGDVTRAVRSEVRRHGGYGIVRDYTGHGIGTALHQAPDVPNTGRRRGPRLVEGMVIAIEPMLTAGSARVLELDDGWTVVTADGSLAAHAEHTIAVTAAGPRILTESA